MSVFRDAHDAFDKLIETTSQQLALGEEISMRKNELERIVGEMTRESTLTKEVVATLSSQLASKDVEVQQLRREIDSLLQFASKEMSAQSQMIQLQYELDVANSKKKSLEREVQLHRAEIERLTRSNQALQRELSSGKTSTVPRSLKALSEGKQVPHALL